MHIQKRHLQHPSQLRPQQNFRLECWHRLALYAVFAALTLSGIVWLVAHYLLRQASEFGESVHPWEHPAMQIHGGLAMLILLLTGSLLQLHIRRAYRARCNRRSGWSMLGCLAVLGISGYGLYYLASEQSHIVWSLGHSLIGLVLPVVVWLHILFGRKAVAHS